MTTEQLVLANIILEEPSLQEAFDIDASELTQAIDAQVKTAHGCLFPWRARPCSCIPCCNARAEAK